jgi:pimeloyl-ACP methyl ester carboxylesterase
MATRCLSCGNSIAGFAQICDDCKARRQADNAARAEAAQQRAADKEVAKAAAKEAAAAPQVITVVRDPAASHRKDAIALAGISGALVVGIVVWLVALGGATTIGLAGGDSRQALVIDTPSPTPPAPLAPLGYERGDCPFEVGDLQGVECGSLTVPMNRAEPDTGRVRLPVAVFRSDSANRQPDPVVYLDGGPGGNTIEGMPWVYLAVKDIAPDRDVVIFDQRGAGGSNPSLDCPEVQEVNYELLIQPLTIDQRVIEDEAAVKTCRDRLVRAGIDPSFANSAENAADVNDLRIALGYEQWNLFGVSYGTKLALTVMRDYPEGVRSVILDSVYPPQSDLYSELQPDYDRALSALFASCAADPTCAAAYPDLETAFYDTVNALNTNPVQFGLDVLENRTDISARIDGIWLSSLVFSAMYSVDLIPYLPALIFEVRAGHYYILDFIVDAWFQDIEGISLGMHYSVQCSEEMPFVLREAVLQSAKAHPHLAMYSEYQAKSMFASCDKWQAPPAAGNANEAVVSSIPTLVMSGEFDPITPPSWAQLAAANLDHSYYYQYPAVGHGAVFSNVCPADMAEAFLNNPQQAPDGSCIAGITGLEWVIFEE